MLTPTRERTLSTESPDEARLIQPVVFFDPLNAGGDAYDFRPRAEEFDRIQVEEAIDDPKDESAAEPADSSTSGTDSSPESQEDPATAEKVNLEKPVAKTPGPKPTSSVKTSTGKAELLA